MHKLFVTIIVVILAFLMPEASFSQVFDRSRGKAVKEVIKAPLIIHPTGSDSVDARMMRAFKDYWTVSPTEKFDPAKDYDEKKTAYGAFQPVVVGLVIRDNKTSQNYPYFIFGEANKSGRPFGNGIITAFPINCFHYELDVTADEHYKGTYLRIPYIVYNMNDMLQFVIREGSEKGYSAYIDKKSPRLSSKTLLIPQDLVKEWNIAPNTRGLMSGDLEKGKKEKRESLHQILDDGDISYEGKYKVVSNADILKLEASPDANKYALFLPAINDQKYIMAFDLSTKELLYFEEVTMSMAIKGKDWNRINKVVGF